MEQLLRYDHVERVTASEALKHPYLAPVLHQRPSSSSNSSSSSSSSSGRDGSTSPTHILGTPPVRNPQALSKSISVDHASRTTSNPLLVTTGFASSDSLPLDKDEEDRAGGDADAEPGGGRDDAVSLQENVPTSSMLERVKSFGLLRDQDLGGSCTEELKETAPDTYHGESVLGQTAFSSSSSSSAAAVATSATTTTTTTTRPRRSKRSTDLAVSEVEGRPKKRGK